MRKLCGTLATLSGILLLLLAVAGLLITLSQLLVQNRDVDIQVDWSWYAWVAIDTVRDFVVGIAVLIIGAGLLANPNPSPAAVDPRVIGPRA